LSTKANTHTERFARHRTSQDMFFAAAYCGEGVSDRTIRLISHLPIKHCKYIVVFSV